MIYFDNAATTWPKPEQVYQRMDRFFRESGANPGRSGHAMAAAAGKELFEVRERIAEFFGAEDSSEIIFTSSATHSLNLGIYGIAEAGDHVITSCLEHNSVIRPLKELERKGIIELSLIGLTEKGELDYEQVEKMIRPNTKMIVMIHGSNLTGHIFNLAQIGSIAKKHKILFMVDAAQTAGVFPLNMCELPVDLLAVPGHKSLYGPPGTGILYIRKGTDVKAMFAGGTGSKSEELYQPEVWPDKFESGTTNSVGFIGLGTGLEYVKEIGIDTIREHELSLCRELMLGLRQIANVRVYGPEVNQVRTPVVSFNIGDESSSEIGYILDQIFGIGVRSGLHCSPLAHRTMGTLHQGMVRVSFGYFNNVDEVHRLLEAVEKISLEVG